VTDLLSTTPCPRSFYDRATVTVARSLLGCRIGRAGLPAGRIVETEAYVGNDPANHAARGRTDRNRSMFGAPGTLYVYRIHQVHCANAVTRPGQAVLLRALEPLDPALGDASGPGRLCRALGLTVDNDGADLVSGPLQIYPRTGPVGPVVRSPRVGIRKAAERPLRFAILGNEFVSSPRPWGGRRPTA
jgi:DNA-3-methyladenine glycosylase